MKRNFLKQTLLKSLSITAVLLTLSAQSFADQGSLNVYKSLKKFGVSLNSSMSEDGKSRTNRIELRNLTCFTSMNTDYSFRYVCNFDDVDAVSGIKKMSIGGVDKRGIDQSEKVGLVYKFIRDSGAIEQSHTMKSGNDVRYISADALVCEQYVDKSFSKKNQAERTTCVIEVVQ